MGTVKGGMKALNTLIETYGRTPDGKSAHHSAIGRMGGSAPKTKPSGFAAMNRADVQAAGKKGGLVSRRRPTEEQLKHQSEAMKARWAARKADQA